MVFKCEIETSLLKKVLEHIDPHCTDFVFEANMDLWHTRVIDDGRVVLLDITIPKSRFASYVGEGDRYGLDVAVLRKVCSVAKTPTIGIGHFIDKNCLIWTIGNMKYRSRLNDIRNIKPLGFPTFNVPFSCDVPASELITITKMTDEMEDTLGFIASNGKIMIGSKDDKNDCYTTIQIPNTDPTTYESHIGHYFAGTVFKNIKADIVNVSYANNYPITFKYDMDKDCPVIVMIAPKNPA